MKKRVAILGSTGSVGKNTVKVLKNFPADFEVVLLVANQNYELLAKQAVELEAKEVVITNRLQLEKLKSLLPASINSCSDDSAISEIIECYDVDIVVCAIIGTAGFIPVLNAIKQNRRIGLASKEVMVMAGEFINQALAKHSNSSIIPVDSEHSAIFQCLQNRNVAEVKSLILTSSGGPFRNYSQAEIEQVTLQDALNHPIWSMGQKITIDSASMMNKALEVIEAHHLFKVNAEAIKVIIHKEAIIHSMVEFVDNSSLALLSNPSMELPIQYALTYPEIRASQVPSLELTKIATLSFQEVNQQIFPAVNFAYEAIRRGGTSGAILNAANEVAVEKFCQNRIKFHQIWSLVETVISKCQVLSQDNLENIIESDKYARVLANELS